MFVVIFEVNPKPERWDDYVSYATLLTPELKKIDGFVDNERFASKRRAGWLVSMSTWRDEKALIRWRTLGVHHEVQAKGRAQVFRDYHLRVGEIVADTHLPHGCVLREQRFDETDVGAAKIATLTERSLVDASSAPIVDALAASLGGRPGGTRPEPVEWDVFEHIYQPARLLLLNFWCDAGAVRAWLAEAPEEARHRTVRLIRDYGMFDRAEAPQYYPTAQ
ncbi:MAG TPA: antibiotic biosynthesis monooxygenase [bacterium]|nr:antibiotic biosynthesis monooxygenase [bacterium]